MDYGNGDTSNLVKEEGYNEVLNGIVKIPIYVEVVLKDKSDRCDKSVVRKSVSSFLHENYPFLLGFTKISQFTNQHQKYPGLFENVQEITCEFTLNDNEGGERGISLKNGELIISIFYLDQYGMQIEEMDMEGEGMGGDSPTPAAHHCVLPSAFLQGQWENLHYDDDVKEKLVKFVGAALYFSKMKVDPNLVSWNRIVLLHGPPGTGKTSLCRAVAQKLTIRHQNQFTYGQLIEINSHSLFSKWFSESGKLVHKMFEKIQDLVDDPQALICVLIDEVESLAAARKSSGSEPGDAIRVVNALFTAIDQIKQYPNVVIFTTSNITGSIDLAFVDRADIKHYIGYPTVNAIYKMFHGSITNIVDRNIIKHRGKPLLGLEQYRLIHSSQITENQYNNEKYLMDICQKSVGYSGRTLRKLPFLAFASIDEWKWKDLGLIDYLKVLDKEIDNQKRERDLLTLSSQS